MTEKQADADAGDKFVCRSARGSRKPTENDRRAILACRDRGLSQSATARELGLSQPGLSRWSKREGISWAQAPSPATEVQRERLRQARRDLAEQTMADALEIRKRLWGKGIQHVATRDGVETIETDLPSARDVADLATAVERLVRVSAHADALDAADSIPDQVSMLGLVRLQMAAYVAQEAAADEIDVE
ncbi:hypothetical protein [Gordonia sp. NPDC003950]